MSVELNQWKQNELIMMVRSKERIRRSSLAVAQINGRRGRLETGTRSSVMHAAEAVATIANQPVTGSCNESLPLKEARGAFQDCLWNKLERQEVATLHDYHHRTVSVVDDDARPAIL